MFDNATCYFPLSHDDEVRSKLAKVFYFSVRVSTCDDLQIRICSPGLLDEIATFERIGDGTNKPTGLREVRGAQDIRLQGICVKRLYAAGTQLFNNVLSLFNNE